MNKFAEFLEKYLTPIAEKMSNNKYLKSVADGVVATMPLTMVAAIFSIIGSLPNILPFLPAWSEDVFAYINAPYNFLFGMLALVISFTVAYRHANVYKLNQMNCGLVSLLCFIMIVGLQKDGSISTIFFGYSGIFTAVFTALISVEIYQFMVKKKLWIKMPATVPPVVSSTFEQITPLLALIVVFYGSSILCQRVTGDMIPVLIQSIVTPAIKGSDSIWYQVLIHFFMQLFFWIGLHGWAVLAGIMIPISTTLLAGNVEAAANSQALPYFTAGGANFVGTWGWFIPLMLLFMCKAKRNKAIGKMTIVPGIFGITEPHLFGTPIVLNPILAIPFIIYQPICVAITFACTKYGLMARSAVSQLAGVPQPFATWICCNGDFRVFLVFAVLCVVTFVIWYPFIKVWDNKCLKEEKEAEAELTKAVE